MHLCDDDDAHSGAGADDVAFIDHPDAGVAVDGGGDGRIAELRPGEVDGSLIGGDQCLELRDLGAGGIDGFLQGGDGADLGDTG